MWSNHAAELFREYMGTGIVVIWFLAALVYLFVKEERKPVRILFLYVPVLLLLLFFNPVFSKIFQEYAGDEIYYRMLWLLPITVVIAYAVVSACKKRKGWGRVCCAGIAACLTVISGNCIYKNPFFSKAENLYHVPDGVVHICDAIAIEGREVTAVFPLELVQYVRQYSSVICMPYGREMLVDNRWTEWTPQHELCDVMEAEEPDAQMLGALAREWGCIYIILPESKRIQGDLQAQGYDFLTTVSGYNIYRDVCFEPGV